MTAPDQLKRIADELAREHAILQDVTTQRKIKTRDSCRMLAFVRLLLVFYLARSQT